MKTLQNNLTMRMIALTAMVSLIFLLPGIGAPATSQKSVLAPQAESETYAKMKKAGALIVKARAVAREFGLDMQGSRTVQGGGAQLSEPIVVIATPDGDFAVKKIKLTEEDNAKFIIEYMQYLLNNGVPFHHIRKAGTDGSRVEDYYAPVSMQETGKTEYYHVERWVPGKVLSRKEASQRPEALRSVGRLLGRIHRLSSSFRSAYAARTGYSFRGALAHITAPGAPWRQNLARYLPADDMRLVDGVVAAIQAYWTPERLDRLSLQPIPSDLNFGNILFDETETEPIGVIDWDQARIGCPLEDFFATLVQTGRQGEGLYVRPLTRDLDILLEGYREECPLTMEEYRMLPMFFTAQVLVHLSFGAAMLTGDPGRDAALLKQSRCRENVEKLRDICLELWAAPGKCDADTVIEALSAVIESL